MLIFIALNMTNIAGKSPFYANITITFTLGGSILFSALVAKFIVSPLVFETFAFKSAIHYLQTSIEVNKIPLSAENCSSRRIPSNLICGYSPANLNANIAN